MFFNLGKGNIFWHRGFLNSWEKQNCENGKCIVFPAFVPWTGQSLLSKDVCETTIQGQYPLNTTITDKDSIINGVREERFSGKNGVVEVHNFPGATIEDIFDKLLKLKTFIIEKCPHCQTTFST